MLRSQMLCAAMALALASTAAQAETVSPGVAPNLVENGSFEDIGSLELGRRSWSFFNEIPGWTGAPTGEVQSDRTISQVNAQDGDYYIELDTNQNSMIFQDVNFAAAAYELSFFYSPRVKNPDLGTNDMTFAVSEIFEGAVKSAPNEDYPYKTWTEVTMAFIVDIAGRYRLSFAGAGAENERNGCGDCGALIDNVRITPTITGGTPDLAPVPLPAPVLLLLAGLGGLGALRLRPGQVHAGVTA